MPSLVHADLVERLQRPCYAVHPFYCRAPLGLSSGGALHFIGADFLAGWLGASFLLLYQLWHTYVLVTGSGQCYNARHLWIMSNWRWNIQQREQLPFHALTFPKVVMNSDKYGQDRLWPFAEGGETTIAGITTVFALALILWYRLTTFAAGVFLFVSTSLWLLILYFFRDPNRDVINVPGQVIGPGDGEVVEIVHERENRYLQTDVIRISMFLNIHDVHIQRVPLGGRVTLVHHQLGKFLQAFRPEASDVNEYIAMVVEGAYGRILIKQIAGILARRCVNKMRPGDVVTTGQRFGLIKFSSRLDLYLPADAQLLVSIGDKVYGGLTPIAQLSVISEP